MHAKEYIMSEAGELFFMWWYSLLLFTVQALAILHYLKKLHQSNKRLTMIIPILSNARSSGKEIYYYSIICFV